MSGMTAKKKPALTALLLAGCLILSAFLSGCSKKAIDTNSSANSESSAGETYTGKIKEIQGSTITLALGTLQSGAGGPSGTKSGSTPPAAPGGTSGSEGGFGAQFQANGSTKTISFSSSTAITISGSAFSLMANELAVGDVVAVTMDSTTISAVSIQVFAAQGDGTSGSIALTATKEINGTTSTLNNQKLVSAQSNQNSLLVTNGGSLVLNDSEVTKSGDTTSEDESNFFGLNAAVAAASASTLTINSSSITTSAEGANAVFATGENTVVRAADLVIHTAGNSSRGLDATYGGSIIAQNVTVTTTGAHCAALATDRGGGTVSVEGGTLDTSGDGSPCIYSTGSISASSVTGTAGDSQCMVIEGKNSITLDGSTLTGSGKNGVMTPIEKGYIIRYLR